MKRLLQFAFFMLLSATLYSQTITITLQVTDTGAQTWNNGSWTAQLVPPQNNPTTNFKIAGTSTTVPNQQQTGFLNGTGGATLTLTPNTIIAPANTQWVFNVCPQATSNCYQFSATLAASQTLTLTPPVIAISMVNPPARVAAYSNSELFGMLPGNQYWNLTTQVQQVWNGVSWQAMGGGGGGSGCTVNPADGGCALAGIPSIDLFACASGSQSACIGVGTAWTAQWLNNQVNFSVPLNVLGTQAGILTLNCTAVDPGISAGAVGLVAFVGTCSGYNMYFPQTAGSGFLTALNTAGKINIGFQASIDLTSNVVNILPLANGGTGSATGSGALVNLFPNPIRNGDIIYWNGSAWNNLGGNNGGTGGAALAENTAGNPNWVGFPIPVVDGGWGLNTLVSGDIYKGAGTGAPTPSALSDNGTNVTSTEPLIVPGCTGCGGSPFTYGSATTTTVNASTTSTQVISPAVTPVPSSILNSVGTMFTIRGQAVLTPGSSITSTLYIGFGTSSSLTGGASGIWGQVASAAAATISFQFTCTTTATGTSGTLSCSQILNTVGGGTNGYNGAIWTVTANLTVPLYYGTECQFSAASTSNSCTQNLLMAIVN